MPLSRQNSLSFTEVRCSCWTTKDQAIPKSPGVKEPEHISQFSFQKWICHCRLTPLEFKKQRAQGLCLSLFLLGGPLAAVYWLCSSKANWKKPGCSGGGEGPRSATALGDWQALSGVCGQIPSPNFHTCQVNFPLGLIVSQVVLNEFIVYLTPITSF